MYTYTNQRGIEYHLNRKEVILKGSKKEMVIHYFSKDTRETACEMPPGYEVVENGRTGLPVLRRT